MEFFRLAGGTATVTDVMRISANGLQVRVICPTFILIFILPLSHNNVREGQALSRA